MAEQGRTMTDWLPTEGMVRVVPRAGMATDNVWYPKLRASQKLSGNGVERSSEDQRNKKKKTLRL